MSQSSYHAIVLRDRDAIEALVDDFFGRGPLWRKLVQGLPFVADSGDRHGGHIYCVQRQGRLLGDHTIEENWKLPLWELVADDLDEWRDLVAQACDIFARYSSARVSAYPGQLDGVSLVAAQFSQAYIMKPDVLLLDSVLNGWYHADQAVISRMVRDYAARFPFRTLVYADVIPPPAGVLPFVTLDLPSP